MYVKPFLAPLSIGSLKATKFCEISTLLLSYVVPVKSKVEISQNFVSFTEYMQQDLESIYGKLFFLLKALLLSIIL